MGIIQKMDFLILNWLQKHLRGKTLDILMPMITALGNGGFLFALLTIGLLCTRRWRREGMARDLTAAVPAGGQPSSETSGGTHPPL